MWIFLKNVWKWYFHPLGGENSIFNHQKWVKTQRLFFGDERRMTPYSLDIILITTRLSIAANRRMSNRLSYSTSRVGLTTSRCASPRHARNLSSIFSKILSTFNQDHHCFVAAAECCTHFPQLIVRERKKKLRLGLKLAKELIRIPNKSGHFSRDSFSLLHQLHPKTLFEMPMFLSLNSDSFPSNSNVSATFSFWIHSGKFWNPTNCEKFNAVGSLTGRTNLDKSVW